MRIELLGGSGSVAAMKSSLDNLYNSISDSIRELASTEDKVHDLLKNESSTYLFKTMQGLQNRIETENNKLNAVASLRDRANQFISNTVVTDHQVALVVSTNERMFFEKYPALKPREESLVDRFANLWTDFKEGWDELWGTIGDAISVAVDAVVDFIKEHWVELLVGTVFIVLGAALTALTGGLGAAFMGSFLSALAKGFVFAATQAVIGGIISAGIAAVFGGDVWAAFGDGLASGYMWGGIFYFVSSAVTAIRTAMAARKAAKVGKIANTTKQPIYTQETLKNLKNTENLADDAVEHIFNGSVKSKGVDGFHFNGVEGTKGKIISGTEKSFGKFGAYNAKVSINGTPKKFSSTFWPDSMSPQEVIDSINQALKNGVVQHGNTYVGNAANGMKIQYYLNKAGKITNAFPFCSGYIP